MIDVGVDIVEIGRIRDALQRHEAGFRRRVYTDTEWRQCSASMASLAGRFAAKEAVMKALGVGGMKFRDIEIVRLSSGKPDVRLLGRMQERAQRLGIETMTVSISHSRDNAVAVAIAERSPGSEGART